MRNQLKEWWFKIPRATRKPIVIVTGFMFILLSGLIGWLPGPGGMVPFLIGIAILATEFTWAERFRDYIISSTSRFGQLLKKYPVIGGISVLLFLLLFWGAMYYLYEQFK